MIGGFFRKVAIAAGIASIGLAAPAAAQFSDAYEFLKSIRDRDGTKVNQFLSRPGTTLVNTRDRSTGESALHLTIQRRDELWSHFLLDKGADPNAADRNGTTPLAIAAGLGFVEGVEMLVKRGARVDVANAAGETPLISAVHRRDMGIIRLLLRSGASADRTDNSGRSARDYARLMGPSSGVQSELDRAEAERKSAGASRETYGPGA